MKKVLITTRLLKSNEERISKIFPVAGPLPHYITQNELDSTWHYETNNLSLYEIANYLDLYTIASYGENRKFIQIFNKNDPCCYDGDSFLAYEDVIKTKIQKLKNGFFDVHLDDTHNEHKISAYSLEIIINSIQNEEL